jgi:hypothetical protein
MSMAWVLIAQVMASSAMAAIAWFVQEVHYPLFARVSDGSDASAPGGKTGAAALDYHAENLRRTRPIVLVPMVVEAATATWLAVFPPAAVGRAPAAVARVDGRFFAARARRARREADAQGVRL